MAVVGLGLGGRDCVVLLGIRSAPVLALSWLLAPLTDVRVPDHNPGDVVAPLVAGRLEVYMERDPVLVVRRTLPNELFQLLCGSASEDGISMGLLVVGDPATLRRYSNDGLDAVTGDWLCAVACASFAGSTPGRR